MIGFTSTIQGLYSNNRGEEALSRYLYECSRFVICYMYIYYESYRGPDGIIGRWLTYKYCRNKHLICVNRLIGEVDSIANNEQIIER